MGRKFAHSKYDELGERIRELTRMRRQLGILVRKCDSNKRGALCPLILALTGDDPL